MEKTTEKYYCSKIMFNKKRKILIFLQKTAYFFKLYKKFKFRSIANIDPKYFSKYAFWKRTFLNVY